MNSKLLILDLDETLLYATEQSLGRESDFLFAQYHVYLRPHLSQFLAFCSENFRLAVWTSSSEDYAQCVVEHVFGTRYPLEFVWARSRCTCRFDANFMDYEWHKNLDKIRRKGQDLSQVIMLDDTPRKLARHYGNLLRVKMFEGDPTDNELSLLIPYLDKLRQVSDVRKVEKRNWRETSLNIAD